MPKISEIYKLLDEKFPFSNVEEWDNSGILVYTEREITKIAVALDATAEVVKKSADEKAQLIITHHPVIFNPLKKLSCTDPAVIAAEKSIGIISAHTNFDVSEYGPDACLSQLLKERIGFCEDGILDITVKKPYPSGFGRIGHLSRAISSNELAKRLSKLFCCENISFASCKKSISMIGFCCGGGSEYFTSCISNGADAFITADVKHNTFTEAKNLGAALFSPTHYKMEKPAMKNIVKIIAKAFPDITVYESKADTEPLEQL